METGVEIAVEVYINYLSPPAAGAAPPAAAAIPALAFLTPRTFFCLFFQFSSLFT